MNSGAELLLLPISIALIGGWGLNIWALIRAFRTPDTTFRQIGKTRSGQLTLHIFGIFAGLLGIVAGWVWFFTTRKQLIEMDRSADRAFLPPPPLG
jgi:hypothetical protein